MRPVGKRLFFRHFPWMIAADIIGMAVNEYYGWKLLEKLAGKSHFPGFFTVEVVGSIVVNSLGALFTGLLFMAAAFVIPAFRRNWKANLHIPLWSGIAAFLLFFMMLIAVGFNSI